MMMDYMGQTQPASAEGHRYILLVVCYMTKFILGVCHVMSQGHEITG